MDEIPAIQIEVDARDVRRGIYQVRETLTFARSDHCKVLLPDWLPAFHAPQNAVKYLAGLTARSEGKIIAWQRDPINMSAFHIDFPEPVTQLELEFQLLTPTLGNQGRVVVSEDILRIQWASLCLYPSGIDIDDISVSASVKLPTSWLFATALTPRESSASTIHFETVSMRTLVDSPILAGQHCHIEQLDDTIRLSIFADRADQLPLAGGAELSAHQNLIAEADALFGSRPFKRYDFLMALSEELGSMGLEHRASSENGVRATYFSDWTGSVTEHDLLPHEYTHSWVGKYRIPAGNLRPDFCQPMTNELMWVYEGLTQYYGHILAARCGLISPELTRDAFALIAATYDRRPGRDWRPLADTVNDPIINGRGPMPWRSWRRSEDYYSEGLLLWLEADMLIRSRSGGHRSLDDFARSFFAPPDAEAPAASYNWPDIVNGLSQIEVYDWNRFLRDRVERIAPHAPLGGIRIGGYALDWQGHPSAWLNADQHHYSYLDLSYSLGLTVGINAVLIDVMWDGPAYRAGLIDGAKLLAVGGVEFSDIILQNAVDLAAQRPDRPIELTVKQRNRVSVVTIDWHGGQQYPVLAALDQNDRLLDFALAPRRMSARADV